LNEKEVKKYCFARRHFSSPAVDSFYRYAYDVSHERDEDTGRIIQGWFYRSDRRDAADFGVGKNTITRFVTELVRNGWFREASNPRTRKPGGQFASIVYKVLSHTEWTNTYGSEQCRYTDAVQAERREKQRRTEQKRKERRLDNSEPVPTIGTGPVPIIGTEPVPTMGTKIEVENEKRDRELPSRALSEQNSSSQVINPLGFVSGRNPKHTGLHSAR
jgi:hypothetical protein